MEKTGFRSLIVVAVPILRVSARVVFEKGRGWSAVDELVLWALNQQPRSARQLSTEMKLPPRVIFEVILRMMRFRLIEVVLLKGMSAFRTTAYGSQIVSGGTEIPALRRKLSRKISFVVDQITGTVFPKREVRVDNQAGLVALRDMGANVRRINVPDRILATHPAENVSRFQEVLNPDETLIFFDGDSLIEREDEYMTVTVDGDDLRGLPSKAPSDLKQSVMRVARAKAQATNFAVPSQMRRTTEPLLPEMISVNRSDWALILGGYQHGEIMRNMLGAAKRRIFIHSTFLRKDRFDGFLPLIRDAVRRGVRIDVFWGAGDPDEPSDRMLKEAASIAKALASDELLRRRVTIHLRSTGSHAKLLLADDGEGSWAAAIGSCNWLYSQFDRLELSTHVTASGVVANLADRFSRMVSKPGFRPEVGNELFLLARALRESPPSTGDCELGVVAGPMHEAVLRVASGQDSSRLIIASDRLGNAAFVNAIIPAETFAKRTGRTPMVLYGQTSGVVMHNRAAEQTNAEAIIRGVRLIAVEQGFHAKFLAWGDDDVVITSLNWGSATSSSERPENELGLHLHGPQISKNLFSELAVLWPALLGSN